MCAEESKGTETDSALASWLRELPGADAFSRAFRYDSLHLDTNPSEEESKDLLVRALATQSVVAFVGAGVSHWLCPDFPTWKGLAALCGGPADTQYPDVVLGDLDRRQSGASGYGSPVKETIANRLRMIEDKTGAARLDAAAPLASLPIRRFVTTNYDLLLERALDRHRRSRIVPADGEEAASFTHLAPIDHPSRMRLLIADDPDASDLVFHCHGRRDIPRSMIVTPADYQELYSEMARDHQGTLNLVLRGNPLLFLGYSLSDPDISAILRYFGADLLRNDIHGHMFWVDRRSGTDDEWERRRQHYWSYYGVSLIGTADLGAFLGDVAKTLSRARAEVAEYPPLRKPWQHGKKVFCLYGGDPSDDERVKQAAKDILTRRRTLVYGPKGTAKSRLADTTFAELAREIEGSRGSVERLAYVNLEYANDFISLLDDLCEWLAPQEHVGRPRIARLRDSIDPQVGFIIRGCEHLLASQNPFRAVAKDFLKVVWEQSGFVLLTARRSKGVPRSLRRHARASTKLRHFLPRTPTQSQPIFERKVAHRTDLAGLLAWICEDSETNIATRVAPDSEDIEHRLYAAAESEIAKRLKMRLDDVRRQVDALAEVGRPMPKEYVLLLFPANAEPWFEVLRESGLYRRLYLGTAPSRTGRAKVETWVMSSDFRRWVLNGRVLPTTPDPSPIGIHGFITSARVSIPMTRSAVRSTMTIAARLLHSSMGASVDGSSDDRRTSLARHAFAIVRQRLPAVGVFADINDEDMPAKSGRNNALAEYVTLMMAFLARGKELGGSSWSVAPDDPQATSPFYLSDLAWIANQLGLAFYLAGHLRESRLAWHGALFLASHLDPPHHRHRPYAHQALLQAAIIDIAAGRLIDAERALRQLQEELVETKASKTVELRARVAGTWAHLRALRGEYSDADVLFARALDDLRGDRNVRAYAYLCNLRGHMLAARRTDRDIDAARARFAEALAIAGRHRLGSTVAEARVGLCRCERLAGNLPEAIHNLQQAAALAERNRFRRIEADVAYERSRIASERGDVRTAMESAEHALMLANRFAPGLRTTRALQALGVAMLGSSETSFSIQQRNRQHQVGRGVLRLAHQLAVRQTFWARASLLEILIARST